MRLCRIRYKLFAVLPSVATTAWQPPQASIGSLTTVLLCWPQEQGPMGAPCLGRLWHRGGGHTGKFRVLVAQVAVTLAARRARAYWTNVQ
jgi:hypothetical protein